MEPVMSMISNVGFPIFIAVFLLIRIEPTMKRLDITIAKILYFLEHKNKEG